MVLHTQASYGMGHKITGKYWLDLSPDDMVLGFGRHRLGEDRVVEFLRPMDSGRHHLCHGHAGQIRSQCHPQDPRGLSDLRVLRTGPPPCGSSCAKDLKAHRFARLRHCVSAGETLNPPVAAAWKAGTGLDICEGTAKTEMVCLIGYFRGVPGGMDMREGSMGRAAPGFDVAIVDESACELPAGKVGQIAVRVKPSRPLALFAEYWKKPRGDGQPVPGGFLSHRRHGPIATRTGTSISWAGPMT